MKVKILQPGVITEDGEIEVGVIIDLSAADGESVIKLRKGKEIKETKDKNADGKKAAKEAEQKRLEDEEKKRFEDEAEAERLAEEARLAAQGGDGGGE